ncbi:MAG TPA: three-Cys-motif partner protein TcmP [Terrimicrobiaceae bacterium]
MPTVHRFGGDWTRTKLEILQGYLKAYSAIFNGNEQARYFQTWYVDAFAGTGYVDFKETKPGESASIWDDLLEPETEQFLKGSATIALEVDPGFKNHLFIDTKKEHCVSLDALKEQFPNKRIEVLQGEANDEISKWVQAQNWKKTRAVVFLDPYGMQVDWKTIEMLGTTKGVDLWLLLPLGVALARMLPRNNLPSAGWAQRLDRAIGTSDWRHELYEETGQVELFDLGGGPTVARKANTRALEAFMIRRLETVFHAVHPNPRPLLNSRGNPLYLLCFAAGNERGAKPAMRIAKHLLEPRTKA